MCHCETNRSEVCIEKAYKLSFALCFSVGDMRQRGESWALGKNLNPNSGSQDQAVSSH